MKQRAVILLSGGLDSATCLAIARDAGFDCYAISFDYGQRHRSELAASKKVARALNAKEHKIVQVDASCFGGSALTDKEIAVPDYVASDAIPITYVPARNLVFLSLATSWAEALKTTQLFIGVNEVDYSGYPDCRPAFIEAFRSAAQVGTKQGVEGQTWQIHTPLMALNKAEIILKGIACGVDYALTVSCYSADEQGAACGRCDSCAYRKMGFATAEVDDPTLYQS